MYSGSPGICELLFRIALETGNDSLLNYAKKGAQWLIDLSEEENGGYKWPYARDTLTYEPGFYTGTSGIGDRFLNFYEITKDTIYLHYGLGAADWLAGADVNFNNTGIDIISGAAGQGLFMLRAYSYKKNQAYLDFARRAAEWLIDNAIPEGNGFKWQIAPGAQMVYTGFSHGTAGVGYFLAELFNQTKDSIYLEYAKGAAQWLVSIAIAESGGYKWWAEESDKESFSTGWCHGPAGTCLLFLKLFEITKDNTYRSYAEKGARWLISRATAENGGYKWEQWIGYSANDVTICHGAAGIGEYFYEMYKTTLNKDYLEYAKGAADWLVNVAEPEAGGYKWSSYGYYYTGHSVGAAGIGLFLLKMSDLISSTGDKKVEDIKVYPNPAGEWIKIKTDKYYGDIEIYSANGMLVMKTGYEEYIDISGLAAGLYFIRCGGERYSFVKM